MSQPNIKYLNKANELIQNFNQSINNGNTSQSFIDLYNLRCLHGKLIYKSNSVMKKKKSSKRYFYLSSLNSIINLINEKIVESESKFDNYIKENKIDISKLKIPKKSESSVSSNSSDSESSTGPESSVRSVESVGSVDSNKSNMSLPLFEGEKSVETRKRDSINMEIKSHKVEQFNESIPSLLLFFNPGCPACIKTKPHWESLTANLKKSFTSKNGYNPLFNIMEIDLSDASNENLATLFSIEYIPTIIMMESSKKPMAKIDKLEGASNKEKINEFIKSAYAKFSK